MADLSLAEELCSQGGPYLFIKTSGLQRILIKVHLERYHKAREWLVEHFQGRGVRILDLACGTGYGSRLLASVGEVVGVDMDEEVVEHANRHYKTENTSFEVGNADDVNFLDHLGTFDVVVSLATIEHLEDHYRFLAWVKRILRPGGASIISCPSTFTRDWAAPHHRRDISCRAARRLFQKCGFEIVKAFHQRDRLSVRHILRELRTNEELPAPPLRHWIVYYLRRPDHLLMRAYQIVLGGGILFAHQQYLLFPSSRARIP
ncbi:MAG: methyltransferase domain-containing protein [Anaerolineae bacterium]|jgi:ubiquinone/menaquinone biosynthesis C-methylase UbiE